MTMPKGIRMPIDGGCPDPCGQPLGYVREQTDKNGRLRYGQYCAECGKFVRWVKTKTVTTMELIVDD